MSIKRILKSLALAVSLGAAALSAGAVAAPALPSAMDFARLPAIDSVDLSPDGKHIAAVTSPDGVTATISVWDTEHLDRPPVVIPPAKAKEFRFFNVRFVKNDRLAVTFRQLLDIPGGGKFARTHNFKTILMGWAPGAPPPADIVPVAHNPGSDDYFDGLQSASILDILPRDPRRILAIDPRSKTAGDIIRVDVYTGAVERVLHSSDKYQYDVDLNGEVRSRQMVDYDSGKLYVKQEWKDLKTGEWSELFRYYAKDREPMSIAGFTEDPNIVLVLTNKGTDKAAVYEYDITQKKLLSPAFAHKMFDAVAVVQSHAASDYGAVLGFAYAGDTNRIYWVDDRLGGMESQVRQALGVKLKSIDWIDAATGTKAKIQTMGDVDARLIDYSDDRSRVLIEKSGPKVPPEYYLFDGQKLRLIGRSRPTLNTSALGETRMIEYAARDGLMIPAFLTTPNPDIYGKGPYPAIVLPHGGPWARDELGWDFSGWTQYFAARGYVVLQPQFRGSDGWGQKLWRAGDKEWGQKMQDDNDDAAKWMIAQGIAAPDRIALHGYSYGGYAAFAAAVRPNGLYQCAIAGAGVAELKSFQGETYQSRFIREYQRPTIEGMDPLSHVSQVSIPMLIYHGDRDHTVEISESRRFAAGLKSAGKPFKFVELPDMGHQYVLWRPDNHVQILQMIEQYLKTDCGPGGL